MDYVDAAVQTFPGFTADALSRLMQFARNSEQRRRAGATSGSLCGWSDMLPPSGSRRVCASVCGWQRKVRMPIAPSMGPVHAGEFEALPDRLAARLTALEPTNRPQERKSL